MEKNSNQSSPWRRILTNLRHGEESKS